MPNERLPTKRKGYSDVGIKKEMKDLILPVRLRHVLFSIMNPCYSQSATYDLFLEDANAINIVECKAFNHL